MNLSQLNQFPELSELKNTLPGSDLIAVGGDFSPEMLLEAYYKGIFPWPHEEEKYLWFSPLQRGVLFFDELHLAKSLQKNLKHCTYRFTFNQNFSGVVEGCAEKKRAGQSGTWIFPEVIKAYLKFHEMGFAHSVECWENDHLIGGMYGVCVEGVFSGESMFGIKTDVSKMCLVQMARRLKSKGFEWMDIQMLTPVTKAMGGQYLSRPEYIKLLEKAHTRRLIW